MLLGAACVFQNQRPPLVDARIEAASRYVFRGQTMTAHPVLQPEWTVGQATKDGGSGTVGVFGNLDATDHAGEAWFDRGHAAEFTQIDLWAAYGRRFGSVDTTVGVRHYSWPNGENFPRSPFPSTSEVFAQIGTEVVGLVPTITVHYDIDEVESLYVRGEVVRTFELSNGVRLEVMAGLGWSDRDHSLWLYRTEKSAFSDLGGSIALAFDLDDVTSLSLGVHGSTIVDGDLRDWFDGRIDADVVWVSAGVSWAW